MSATPAVPACCCAEKNNHDNDQKEEVEMTHIKVGMIGLGMMGAGMAGRLIDAGFDVAVYNRTQSAADALVARGARRASSPADAAEPGGIAITMLANDEALQQVTLGEGGLCEKLGKDGVHVSMSTISPRLAKSLAAAHQAQGGIYLGAPVFGRPEAAASGKLRIALAGPMAVRARVEPILSCLSQGIYDMGENAEAANVAKISGNFLISAAIEAMAESFALIDKNGGDSKAFHALMSETIFDCQIYRNYGSAILGGAFTPPGFKMELGAKDVGLVLANGAETHTPMPVASLLNDRFLSGLAKGRGNMDWVAIAMDVAADAGIKDK
jgi:3-hydroxyisobutyrate dehydrogenase-like beta-hydroxyacid dehydrogenase